MRLTAEEHREAIKRYRHIKRARGRRRGLCSAMFPGTVRVCTREKGHRGPHVAHGWLGKILAVWDSGTVTSVSGEAVKRASEARARIGLQTRHRPALRPERPSGLIAGVVRWVLGLFSSIEQVAFLVFFLAFVGFAIQWMLIIFR